MTPNLSRFAAVALLGCALGGCASTSLEREELPPDWAAALPRRPPAAPNLDGVYLNHGQLLRERRQGVQSSATRTLVSMLDPEERLPVGEQVELRRASERSLELIVTAKDRVVGRRQVECEFEPESGAMLLRWQEAIGGTNLPGGRMVARAIRLWRGADGSLFARITEASAGVVVLVPYLGRGEEWGRWLQSTPEGLARLRSIPLPAGAVAGTRALGVGVPFPEFALTDLGDRPLSRESLRGRVVVLIAWSTQLAPDRGDLPRLRELFRRHASLGLEVVMLWSNQGGRMPDVLDYVHRNDLPWRHYVERNGGPNQLIAAAEMRGLPNVLILDREGQIAAANPRGTELEETVTRLLRGPP